MQVGSRGLELTRNAAGGTEVEELWSTRRVQLYHVTSVEQGGYVYGSSGARSPHFLSAIHAKTGEIAWRKRGFAKANVVSADGRLVVLDEDGTLYLASASPDDLTVHSRADVLDAIAWTAPTIVGDRMFVRDRAHLTALDLSTEATAEELARDRVDAEPSVDTPAAQAPPAATAAVDPNEPAAIRILREADAALRAVDSVHYRVTTTPIGRASSWIPRTEGEMVLDGWDGTMPERFWGRVTTHLPDADEPVELTAGGDGDSYYLLDHETKRAYFDIDPNVIGKARRALSTAQMLEFVHDSPLDADLRAEAVELVGEEQVAGTPCHRIRVVYGGGPGEATWFISKEDLLPRRRVQVYGGGESGVDITLTHVKVDPDTDPDRFELRLPEGYELIDDFAP